MMAKDAGNDGTLKPTSGSMNGGSNNGDNNGKSNPKCELSIPSLRDVADKCVGGHLAKFQKLKDEQIEFETSAMSRICNENNNAKGKLACLNMK